jgi:predicted neuraminidase
LSSDEGVTWRRARTLAEEPGAEFSYPFLLQTSDGLVHVTYTWKRRNIRHAAFNLAWLDAQADGKNP